jgi:hypothetical protein
MRRIAALLAVVAVALACMVGGCDSPDRKATADQLEQAIKAMPGVDDATVNSTNDFERGATVHISVFLPDAPSKQIEDVVARINAVRGDAFASFDQTAEFAVTPSRTVLVKRGADLDPAGIASDAEGLRKLTAAVGVAEASTFRNKSTADLTMTKVTTPANDVFAAVRAGFGDDVHLQVNLSPVGIDTPTWQVAFPFAAGNQQRVDQQLAAMPVSVSSITVGSDGTIADLGVSLHNRDTAYQDLVSVIGTIGAGPAHAVTVSWQLDGDNGSPQFSGSVDVGACNYIPNSAAEQHPETYLTPDALALQRRLRKQFDTCPK